MRKRFLMIDGSAVCYSAHYSMSRGKLSHDGNPTAVIFGFFAQIQHACRQLRASHLIFTWDSQKSLRKRISPTYKANRNHTKDEELHIAMGQLEQLKNEIIPELGFVNSFMRPGFEADDLIASLCRFPGPTEDQEYIIMSSDSDLYQLLTNQVSMYKLTKRTLYTKRDFSTEYQIDPLFWSWVKAAAGCSSDNVIGLHKIGEKTACKYIREFHGTKRHPVIDSTEAKKLIEQNMPLVKLPFQGTPHLMLDWETFPSYAAWLDLCERLGFVSFLEHTDTWEALFSLQSPGDGNDRILIGGKRPKRSV